MIESIIIQIAANFGKHAKIRSSDPTEVAEKYTHEKAKEIYDEIHAERISTGQESAVQHKGEAKRPTATR